jgi:hypothetical protein
MRPNKQKQPREFIQCKTSLIIPRLTSSVIKQISRFGRTYWPPAARRPQPVSLIRFRNYEPSLPCASAVYAGSYFTIITSLPNEEELILSITLLHLVD